MITAVRCALIPLWFLHSMMNLYSLLMILQEAQLKADEEMLAEIRKDVIEILMPRVIAAIHNPKVLALFNDQILISCEPDR